MNFVEPYPQTRVLSGKPLQLRRYCAVIIRKQVSTASLSMSFKALPREMPLCARYRHMFQKKGYYLPEKLSRRTSPLGLEGSNGHALSGVRVDGPSGRRFLRGLSLTRLWREGCCRAPLNYRRRPLMKKPLQPPCGRGKTGQPRSARGNAIPLWWLAPPPFPLFEGALWMLSYGAMSLQKSIETYSSP